MSRLGDMLKEAYSYGLTPREADELTLPEMAVFIEANRERDMERTRIMGNMAYTAGMIGSMAFSKTRPKFSDVFYFPTKQKRVDVDLHKKQMLAFAERMNREDRESERRENRITSKIKD